MSVVFDKEIGRNETFNIILVFMIHLRRDMGSDRLGTFSSKNVKGSDRICDGC